MGWEYRGNRLYYYRKRRIGQRVVSEYTGTGEFAMLLSAIDKEESMERAYERADWKKQQAEIDQMNSDINQLTEVINLYVRAVFLINDYHPHKGEWRKTRHA